MIFINLEKAREITKDRLRAERAPLLAALDIEVMRNISNPEKISEIEAKKQELRDVTKQADAALNLDELKAITI